MDELLKKPNITETEIDQNDQKEYKIDNKEVKGTYL